VWFRVGRHDPPSLAAGSAPCGRTRLGATWRPPGRAARPTRAGGRLPPRRATELAHLPHDRSSASKAYSTPLSFSQPFFVLLLASAARRRGRRRRPTWPGPAATLPPRAWPPRTAAASADAGGAAARTTWRSMPAALATRRVSGRATRRETRADAPATPPPPPPTPAAAGGVDAVAAADRSGGHVDGVGLCLSTIVPCIHPRCAIQGVAPVARRRGAGLTARPPRRHRRRRRPPLPASGRAHHLHAPCPSRRPQPRRIAHAHPGTCGTAAADTGLSARAGRRNGCRGDGRQAVQWGPGPLERGPGRPLGASACAQRFWGVDARGGAGSASTALTTALGGDRACGLRATTRPRVRGTGGGWAVGACGCSAPHGAVAVRGGGRRVGASPVGAARPHLRPWPCRGTATRVAAHGLPAARLRRPAAPHIHRVRRARAKSSMVSAIGGGKSTSGLAARWRCRSWALPST